MSEVMKNEIATVDQKQIGSLALITLDPAKYAAEVFQPFHTKLEKLIADSAKVEFDITTTAGMATAVQWRAVFRDEIRIAADKARKDRKAPITLIGKLLESEYKSVEEAAAPYEERFDTAIINETHRKEIERQAKITKERDRIEGIKTLIQAIRALAISAVGKPSSELFDLIDKIDAMPLDEQTYAEFVPDAAKAIGETMEAVTKLYHAAQESERAATEAQAERERIAKAQAAENQRLSEERAALERQRAEFAEKVEEQERQSAAERKTRDDAAAEARRIADAEATEKRRKEDEALAAKSADLQRQQDEIDERNRAAAEIEQNRLEAIAAEQAEAARVAQAETDRISAENLARDAADEAEQVRKADETHRLNIHDEIAEALDGAGVDSDLIPEIIQLIRAGKIPHVSITY